MTDPITKLIKQNVNQMSRNYCILCVSAVGLGKTYSMIKLALNVDPTFNVKRIIFSIPELLEMVHEGKVEPGQAILFDEAGISASNRESYMNKFNKAMSFLLQTWRHRQIILFVTCPSIMFLDKGVRSMFDMIIEPKKIVKSRKVVQCAARLVQHNHQMGKTYYHNLKTTSGEVLKLEISKPPLRLTNSYEKKKTAFTTELYKEQMAMLTDTGTEEKKDIRRCGECSSLMTQYRKTDNTMYCRQCGHEWKK